METTTFTNRPGSIPADNSLLQNFKKSISGRIVTPSDMDYDKERKVYNGMIDKHPGMIVQCKNVADVIACVNFARENNILLAIRGGGHNAGGLGICDEGLVIDLSAMKDIKIDTAAKTVLVQGGCLLKEMDAATHEVGMAEIGRASCRERV